MSETQNPNPRNRDAGQQRRRNNNRNRNRNNNHNDRNRNENRNRPPRSSRPPRPLKLTFWQKFLKAFGLLNEDKLRKQQQEAAYVKPVTQDSPRAPKSNTRTSTTRGQAGDGGQRRDRAPQPVEVESARLYVGNLSYDATEFDIEDLFKGAGTVKKVEIIYNRNTHKSKGYGFVQMLSIDDAKRAVDALHDQPFMGRQLVVNGSKSRRDDDNEDSSDQESSAE